MVKTIPAITNKYLPTSGVVNGISFVVVEEEEGSSVDRMEEGRVAVVERGREEGDRRKEAKGLRRAARADNVADLDTF